MHFREIHYRSSALTISIFGLALLVGTGGISLLGSKRLESWCLESLGNATCDAMTALESLN